MSEQPQYEPPAAEEIQGDGSPAETCAMVGSGPV
jgi:hypothetical protein